MHTKVLFPALLVGLISFGTLSRAQDAVIPILTNRLPLDSASYRCDEMIQSVNRLRRLGKEQALKTLTASLKDRENDVNVMCICRLLFVNTNGWKPIDGVDSYREMVYTNVLEYFPLFPMAMSDGVPFLIFQGFFLDGRLVEGSGDDLELCKGFPMIEADLSNTNYVSAAMKLLRSEPFLKLYKVPDYAEFDYTVNLVYDILIEARTANVEPPVRDSDKAIRQIKRDVRVWLGTTPGEAQH